MSTAYINCPHCGYHMSTNKHTMQSPFLKQMYASCTNEDCFFVAQVNVEIARQVHPSLDPKPEITGQLVKQKVI